MGADVGAVRWGYVHDATGTHGDEYLFPTALQMPPTQSVECYTPRWSIDTTFQEGREYLKLEATQGDWRATVLRLTPCVFGFSTASVLL